MSKVAIIMGSASDWDVMSPACTTLEEFGIPYEKRVLSAHRNPGPLADYVRAARDNGFDIIIAGAGGAAHLPGVIAALTTLPEVLRAFSEYRMLIYAIILILVMILTNNPATRAFFRALRTRVFGKSEEEKRRDRL